MTDRLCAHPGCDHGLHDGNVSGVCSAHMHGPYCQCTRCGVKPDVAPVKLARAAPTIRPGVRVAEVATYSGVSTARRLNKVSLPAEPWGRK